VTDAPDVVGTNEAAQILGVEVSRIWRMRKGDKTPRTACDLAATPVWHRHSIEALARGERANGGKRLALVGIAEAAEILETSKRQIGRWRDSGKFPEPALDKRDPNTTWTPGDGLAATPLWWRKDITRFKRQRAREAAAAKRAAK
jgi:hypothetical protein